MSRERKIWPRANLDLAEHIDFLSQHNVEAAARFVAAIDKALERIRQQPEVGARYVPTQRFGSQLYFCRPAGFPNHLIFFRYDARYVEIIRILHGFRDLLAALEET